MMLKRSAVFLLVTAPTWFCAPSAFCQAAYSEASAVMFEVAQGATDMPFSAEMITTQVQTLADGTQITRVSKQVQMRDSQGRTRTEIYFSEDALAGDASGGQPMFLTIFDPVANQFIHLDPRQKLATVSHFGPPPEPQASPSAAANPKARTAAGGVGTGGAITAVASSAPPAAAQTHAARTKTEQSDTVENLGGQTIAGVYAEGRRETHVIPAGTEGNNRDITVVTETWVSPELNLDVLRRITDPRSGESTTEIKNLSRDEPAPELFAIPADYKIRSQQDSN